MFIYLLTYYREVCPSIIIKPYGFCGRKHHVCFIPIGRRVKDEAGLVTRVGVGLIRPLPQPVKFPG